MSDNHDNSPSAQEIDDSNKHALPEHLQQQTGRRTWGSIDPLTHHFPPLGSLTTLSNADDGEDNRGEQGGGEEEEDGNGNDNDEAAGTFIGLDPDLNLIRNHHHRDGPPRSSSLLEPAGSPPKRASTAMTTGRSMSIARYGSMPGLVRAPSMPPVEEKDAMEQLWAAPSRLVARCATLPERRRSAAAPALALPLPQFQAIAESEGRPNRADLESLGQVREVGQEGASSGHQEHGGEPQQRT